MCSVYSIRWYPPSPSGGQPPSTSTDSIKIADVEAIHRGIAMEGYARHSDDHMLTICTSKRCIVVRAESRSNIEAWFAGIASMAFQNGKSILKSLLINI